MSRYGLSPRATRDLDQIISDLDRHSRTAGNRIIETLRKKCEMYASNPELGIPGDDFGAKLRCFLVYRYLVFYRRTADGIEVVRVFHGHQNIDPEMLKP